MLKLCVVGGMVAGKTTACQALIDQGFEFIDLDKVGHEVLRWDMVKNELSDTFGDDILDDDGEINRKKLAKKAFATAADTRKLNRITMPRIEEAYTSKVQELEEAGKEGVVVEFSVFKAKSNSLADSADIVMAILAPMDMRVERAVAGGWDEEDVRRRISRQISDAERIEASDVVFENTGSKEKLYNDVTEWWIGYKEQNAAS
ncbi:MAG: dephospho-CoA kinase [Eggerthellaceae bacterium]|nr:dephospho-CoA kinase [Eggerthellaceae bacterium]